jgi:glycosyltransferase involved in cell wall biosynthesis
MEQKIKLCYIINSFEVGGAETVVLDLASGHSSTKFDVTVLAILEKPYNLDSIMLQRFKNRNIKTVSFIQNSFKNPMAIWRLYRFFKQNNFDVVHAHNRPADIWSMRIARIAKIPLYLWTRHLVYQDMTKKQLTAYKNLSESSGPILAVSDAVRNYCISIEKIEDEKVITVVNGINTDMFSPIDDDKVSFVRKSLGVDNNQQLLLFVGRMNQQKAPESFIDLMNELELRGRSTKGFMCGHGPLEETITDLVKNNSNNVEMLGLRDDIPDLLASCDLFISTSRNEGLPLNVMEAMSAGSAFIAPAIEQISCLMKGHQELEYCLTTPPPQVGIVPSETIANWADKVESMLDNPDKMQRVGIKAREVLKNSYSLEKMVSRYESIFYEYLD